jgi:hypothetical protein
MTQNLSYRLRAVGHEIKIKLGSGTASDDVVTGTKNGLLGWVVLVRAVVNV